MAENGLKWWLRYVVVPIIGGGGMVAVIVALINLPRPDKGSIPAPSKLTTPAPPTTRLSPLPSLLPFRNVYLSQTLEVPGHNFQSLEYRAVTSITGKTYQRGLFLDSQNTGPSSVSYQIPHGARLFVATAIARDAGGCGSANVNGWTITITTPKANAAADLSWNYLDPVTLRVPVDNIPADGIQELTITVNPHSDRTCDHPALADPHFTARKESAKNL